MSLEEVNRITARLAMRGLLRAVGVHDNGDIRYELTDKGHFELAASMWK